MVAFLVREKSLVKKRPWAPRELGNTRGIVDEWTLLSLSSRDSEAEGVGTHEEEEQEEEQKKFV